ncbi:hypothetical protein ARZXY2_4576 (plasmid) [Arthrobacter sp. ZXY-2]|nr:hypothetical protein ARZXY2_4576 [Arthrobacter sp. ZXY-2]
MLYQTQFPFTGALVWFIVEVCEWPEFSPQTLLTRGPDGPSA